MNWLYLQYFTEMLVVVIFFTVGQFLQNNLIERRKDITKFSYFVNTAFLKEHTALTQKVIKLRLLRIKIGK